MTKKLSELTTFEEVLERVHEREYLVNNLFQHLDGTWSCSLRRPDPSASPTEGDNGKYFFEYGRGKDPVRAMKIALHNAVCMERYSYAVAQHRLIRRVA